MIYHRKCIGEDTPADSDLQHFWEALQQAKVTDGLLHLDGAWFMGDQLRGQDLLIRDCYISFLDRIKVLLAQGLRL